MEVRLIHASDLYSNKYGISFYICDYHRFLLTNFSANA